MIRQRSRIPPPPAPTAPEPKFPFAILHSGQRIVTLLQPPFDEAAAICIDPCHEHLPATAYNLGSFDRLNLTCYIPELGVAVLATQKGRAAIFTLTTLPTSIATSDRPSPPHSRHLPSPRHGSGASGAGMAHTAARHALRLDWVVPFKSQENRKQRPWSPLLGLATAPVQGCQARGSPVTRSGGGLHDVLNRFGGVSGKEPRPQAGRWRLFLTYVDNTVLTYDLFRDEGSERLLVF
jgi:hypothetical protein